MRLVEEALLKVDCPVTVKLVRKAVTPFRSVLYILVAVVDAIVATERLALPLVMSAFVIVEVGPDILILVLCTQATPFQYIIAPEVEPLTIPAELATLFQLRLPLPSPVST